MMLMKRPTKAKLDVMMAGAGSGLKSAQRKRLVQTNCHALTGGLHDKR
jgi:hypothetical protein